ncbi:MAG: DUF58 domain-containing protein, partial [Saprospiraceae bacterium]|nr:DUF58 domain-containing protein [Saprospiraceae bacterium]
FFHETYFPENRKANELNKIEFSVLAAASLMNLLKKQRDAFGLSIFDSTVHTHTKAKLTTAHYQLLLSYLQQSIDRPAYNKTTSAAEALHQIADSIHKRSLVVIFSDMFEQSAQVEQLFSALQHLKHNKHEVVLFHVVDEAKELSFQFDNRPYLFIDMETGEKVKLQPNQVKEHYVKQVKAFKDELILKCLQYRIDFVEADTKKGFKPILQSYLVKRARMGA